MDTKGPRYTPREPYIVPERGEPFVVVDSGGCAPPVVVPIDPAHREKAEDDAEPG
jgi:hypothetical protein